MEKEEKKLLQISIYVHWIQADIAELLQKGRIDFSKHSLRDIGAMLSPVVSEPQKIKHHLEQLLKWGVINKVNGQYSYSPKQ